MPLASYILSWLALALSALGCVYVVGSAAMMGRYGAAPVDPAGEPPPVTLLKPLHGEEPGLRENLESFARQDYASPVHMVLGLHDLSDPAHAVAAAFAAAHPEADMEVVVDTRRMGSNGKIANLFNMDRRSRHAVLVLSDSDIRVGPDYLNRIAAALETPNVGVASCLYYGRAAHGGFWARFAAMGVSYGFLPQGVVGVGLGVAKPVMGSTVALTRDTLQAVGGFEAFADVLADDFELGRAVRELGLETVIPPFLVAHGSADTSFAELWRHELRWSATICRLDPLGYAGSVITYPLPLALIAALLTLSTDSRLADPACAMVVIAVAARLWLKSRVDAVVGASTGPWWLTPLRDTLSLAVFVAAIFARRVDWRGARFHVGRDGELSPL